MITSIDKALAALIVPVVGALIASGVLPEALATAEFQTGLVAVLTAVAVWLIPNKAA